MVWSIGKSFGGVMNDIYGWEENFSVEEEIEAFVVGGIRSFKVECISTRCR